MYYTPPKQFLKLMNKIFLRIMLVIFVTSFSIYVIFSAFNKKTSNYNLNLGLDLKGGVHLLLKADFDEYVNQRYLDLSQNVKKLFRDHRVKLNNIQSSSDGIDISIKNNSKIDPENTLTSQGVIILEDTKNSSSLKQNIDKMITEVYKIDPNLVVNKDELSGETKLQIKYHDQYKSILLNSIIEQSITTLRNRVDSTGTKEPVIQKQGQDKIILEMPGMQDANSLKNAIGKTAKLSFHIVTDQKNQDTMTLKSENEGELTVFKKPELTGDVLQSAGVTFDEYSRPCVSFKLNSKGTKLFAESTSQNIGRRLAIILDNLIVTAPMINVAITQGSGIISGNFTIDSANEVATFLNSGSLVAKLDILEEKVVGPTLGIKSIEDMKMAGSIAMLFVVGFMISYYRLLGVFASISLSMSLLYMFCMLSLFNATLTMPGIAGIILTIGMAVDANILIYERIKEDLRQHSLTQAIRIGFKTALGTILDSNITTLIVAFVLYVYGTGPIRGFAVALTIGIIASMFSSIIVTKLLIDIWMNTFRNYKLIKTT